MIDFKNLGEQAGTIEDQTKEQAQAERRIIPAGMTYGRLVEYVELGVQKQKPYMGKAKPDAEEVRITFELLTPRNKYTNHEGAEVYDVITWRGAKKLTSKAGFMQLFKKMQRGRAEITHMVQMMNEAFQIEVFHNTTEKDGKTQTWANLFKDQACNISAPVITDPMTGTTSTPDIPAATRPMKAFIWKMPTMECWESIFIDGTYTVKEGEVEVTKSKNVLQETLLGSPAFVGSALEAMLAQNPAGNPLPDLVHETPALENDDVPF